MGGETMAEILRNGQDKLRGAVLVLGAHTELALVRQAIQEAGYHIVQERLCRAAGRFYVFWRAEVGAAEMTQEELRYGSLLWQEASPLLREYAQWRLEIHRERLRGLLSAARQNEQAIREAQADIEFYSNRLEELSC